MTRENERVKFDVFPAPLSHSPPGYKSLYICTLSLSFLITHFLYSISLLICLFCFQKGSSDSHSSEELPTHGDYQGCPLFSSVSDGGVQEMFEELNLSSANNKGAIIVFLYLIILIPLWATGNWTVIQLLDHGVSQIHQLLILRVYGNILY